MGLCKNGIFPDQTLLLLFIMYLSKLNNQAKTFSSFVILLRSYLQFISTANPQTDVILLTESCILDEDGDLQ
jgi:membrane-bound acyltransferase YfiQ involved in biofilm formation